MSWDNEVNDAGSNLDNLVNQAKPLCHECMIGSPQEKDLPAFKSGLKISLALIDKKWLSIHPQDGSQYIQMPASGSSVNRLHS